MDRPDYQHGVRAEAFDPPLEFGEVDGRRAVLLYRWVELPDGRIGWYQRSNDHGDGLGCLPAAVATATQIPLHELGPLRDTAAVIRWAEGRGLSVEHHMPAELAEHPVWIAFTGTEHPTNPRHCLVGAHDRIVFDPAAGVRIDYTAEGAGWQPAHTPLDFERAITFTPKEKSC